MRRALRAVAIGLGALAALAGAGVGYLYVRSPAQRPATKEPFAATAGRLARGRYLVETVCDCEGCHSDRDYTRFGAPIVEDRRGVGGTEFNKVNSGMPGVVCAQNITSDVETGLGAWTDGEIARAIREGVDKNGDALFPMMPYSYYRSMSDEDVASIVVFLRTLPPIKNRVAPKHLDFPVNLLVKGAPMPLDGPVATPSDAADHLTYGRYLVTIGGCRECHTAHDDHGQILAARAFAGGFKMVGPWGTLVTPNITPDPSTFVGSATREQFVARFKAFATMTDATAPKVDGGTTIMAWVPMSKLTEADLGAMFDYLKTLPALPSAPKPG